MSRDTAVPFWRRRIVWLVGVLVLSLIYVLFRSCRDVTGEARLRECALEFLEAADAGDYENCRKAGTMKDRDLHVFRLNRESLGKLVKRTPGRVTPLRFGEKQGYLFAFVSDFEEGTGLQENIAVLAHPEKREMEIFSAHYKYQRLIRPELKESYPGRIPPDVRAKVLRTAQAFDKKEWKYFEALGRREVGYERRGAGRPLMQFQKRFGVAVSRAPMLSVRYQQTLPGCVHLALMQVVNRTGYRVKNVSYDCDETVHFMLDRTAVKPEWQVYAFSPGTPRRITPLPQKKAAVKTSTVKKKPAAAKAVSAISGKTSGGKTATPKK